MTDTEIARINELAAKSRSTVLTGEEKAEQKYLREKYLAEFRSSLRSQLENTVIQRPDGTREKLHYKTNGGQE